MVHLRFHRRLELAHLHDHALHPVIFPAHLGDALREPLEQLVVLRGHDAGYGLGQRPVVDGVGRRVGRPCRRQVDEELDVDSEGLRLLLFRGQDTVHTHYSQARDQNAIHNVNLPGGTQPPIEAEHGRGVMRRTKIVATIGPATSEPDALKALLHAGVDVVRLNAAHGSPEVHAERAATARAAAVSLGHTVGVLIDLPGPKLRTGPVADDEVELRPDSRFVLTADAIEGDEHRVSTTVPELARWVRVGDEVFLADGAIVLHVESINGDDVECRVVRAGVLRSRKGMHVPRAEGHVDPFTDADAIALEMAVRIKADFVGLSFVRRPEDVDAVRARLPKRGTKPHLIAKIETAVALDHLAGIVASADSVMVARGDLGIQIPARRVPLIQKEIIRFCNMAGKPVITATQMLESMTRSPLPTRAEVNDVANAVLDGTDALMLSEETAVGLYPTDTVRMMAEVAEAAEGWPSARLRPRARPPRTTTIGSRRPSRTPRCKPRKTSESRRSCARPGVARPRARVAAFRPGVPIVGISNQIDALGRLTLVWGVRPLSIRSADAERADLDEALGATRDAGIVHAGDLVAVVSASQGKRAGSTDTVRVVRA